MATFGSTQQLRRFLQDAERAAMLRFPHYFALASLACMGLAAVALFMYFHGMAVNTVSRLSETYNTALAKNALEPARESLARFLLSYDQAKGVTTHLPDAVQKMIDEIMRDPQVARIKLFTVSGLIAYATDARLIGTETKDYDGVGAALRGEVHSKMYYQSGLFTLFAGANNPPNLISTYVPVRESGSGEIVGVFEIYRDGAQSVREIEAAERAVLIGAGAILLLLYLTMIIIARRVERRMEAEQRALAERADTLARLGAQMLSRQEAERLGIAKRLQEGAAQTLTAVRMNVASAAARRPAQAGHRDIADQLPIIETAIDEIVEAAAELHPTCLPRLGLVATAQWLCVAVANKHANLQLSISVSGDEAQITPHLKPIVYRTLEQTLLRLTALDDTQTVRVKLDAMQGGIALSLTAEPTLVTIHTAQMVTRAAVALDLISIRDYVVVSGGTYHASEALHGRRTIRVQWREAA
jgi:ABC-type multidrug transport system fused ATPase/permease subunit